jgi:hypothetical protein
MLIIVTLLLLVVAFMLLLVILSLFMLGFDLFLDLPYVATERKKIETIIKFANLKKGQTAVDLGSGDGRLLFAAAQKGAKAIGYELNPFLIALTLIHAKLKGLSSEIWIEKVNLWKVDLKVADVIFVYGRKNQMLKFEEFIYKNAQKGTRIIVNTNPFPTKKPIKSENGIFLYLI